MSKKYGWELDRIDRTESKLLPYDCVFNGKQVSFWEMWHDHQDGEE